MAAVDMDKELQEETKFRLNWSIEMSSALSARKLYSNFI